ncbi:MAG: hypothetical protein ABI051_17785 [Vicinamibacterales bacterium]
MAEPSALRARLSRRHLAAGLVVGLLIRLLLLPAPGSPDVGSWKIWSFAGAFDPASLYGVGGTPPERRLLHWHGETGTTEYPPVALYEISLAGRIYASLDRAFDDSPILTALIKAPGLLAEIALIAGLLLWRPPVLGAAVDWIVLAFWLNPAVIVNGSGLGYLDAQMAVPATLALVAAGAGSFGTAGSLMALALLTKPQALFVAPALLLLLLAAAPSERRHRLVAVTVAGAATTAVLLAPVVLRGAWSNMLQALGRLGAHDMVSGNALNFWWLVTWIVRSLDSLDLGWRAAFTLPVSILSIGRMMDVGYPNPKPIGAVLVGACLLWVIWRFRRGQRLAGAALVGAWCVYAYAMFSAQVHENHAYLAVPILLLAAGLAPTLRPLFWVVSAMTALNMYLFYGIGTTWSPMLQRSWTGVDLSVLLALANVLISGWFTREVLRLPRMGQAHAVGASRMGSGSLTTDSTKESSRLSQ